MKLKKIACELGFSIVGDENAEIRSIKYSDESDTFSIAVHVNNSDENKIKAGAILSKAKIFDTHQNYLVCHEDVVNASYKIAMFLADNGYYPDYNQSVSFSKIKCDVYVGDNVAIDDSTVIEPLVTIGNNVKIGCNCRIESGCSIGNGTVIGNNVIIRHGAQIGSDALLHIMDDCTYKIFNGFGNVIISDNAEIGANTVIQKGTFSNTHIGNQTKIGDLVAIGHDVKIGNDCRITSQTGISGNAVIGNRVCILGQSGVAEYVNIGDDALIIGKTSVTKNVGNGKKISGNYCWESNEELRFQAYIRRKYKERNEL